MAENRKRSARLQAYGLQGDTRDRVKEVGKILLPHLDEVLSDFYEEISDTPDWNAFFPTQALRDHARQKQKQHWVLMLTSDFSQQYFEGAEKIGQVHNRIGLPISFYTAAYARVGLALQGIIMNEVGRNAFFRRRDPTPLMDTLSRVLMLDTELANSAFFAAQAAQYENRLNEISRNFEDEIGRVVDVLSTSMHQLDDAANGMTTEISRARQGADSLSDNASRIATSAQSVASAIEELSASITSITQDVNNAATASANAMEEATASSEQLESLQAAAEEIDEVVNMIAQIAKQTNLLAVNATVEATRAGDAGKGFAVVAFEIKALAERISQATSSINDRIRRIQSETRLMSTRISGIGDCVERARSFSDSIRVAVTEQTQAAQHISQHADSTASSTTEIAQMIRDVSHRVERSGDTSLTLKDAVGTVSDEAGTLSQRVRAFLTALRAA
ncbi:methyl-accepting chemotaxis protein [Rhodovulum sulfidophilum]|uniref:globin-coupled sensor protein n=1 Tax=Rhodovulum sulfidophilum TaxID=35806 RepID=UPI0005AAC246|nr:globin-coupled sensor protein [Rhodovulum sulfidophilum]ANB34786.1 hypothetical protein A6W98_12370 [Rhodovulum sulfidophilum DSM 1374]ANB38609.1 hypothetical protein A6024_12235 [Rhodovulum sulfidophilum]MCW2302095.1 methyl-accepting chemotaxis protein [Rhodovulum sulfidophilum]